MAPARVLSALVALSLPALTAAGQAIIAQSSGLASPAHLIDFGANLFPNLTPITTQFPGITVTHARYFTNNYNNLFGGFLTNDFSGLPNTLRIVFAAPITDVSFVYQQISTAAPSTIRAMLGNVTVDSFSGTWNQSQPNNYFGFTNSYFDQLEIDFVSDFNLDTLAYNDGNGARCVFYNGNQINQPDFTCVNLPVLGTTWQGNIAGNVNTILTFLAYAPAGLAAPTPLFAGELLIQTSPAPAAFAGFGSYSIGIPTGAGWIGTALRFQGFRVDNLGGTPTFVPLNANDLVLGL